jgi:hypothetical protein
LSKPYKLRQNFDNFAEEHPEDYKHLLRLERLFANCPSINRKLYFRAPYHLYKDKEYFDLRYFTTQAAIKSYNLLLKEHEEQSPDSPAQIEFIKDSLFYVRDYCILNNMTLGNYLGNDKKDISPRWAVDMVSNNISIYTLIGFEYFGIHMKEMIQSSIPEDEIEMFFGDYVKDYQLYKNRLNNSTKAKRLIIEGIKNITKNITKKIQNELKSKEKNDNILVTNE